MGDGGIDTLGAYVLDECIGHGGMGSVYRARHSSTGAIVAIKRLHLSHDDEQRQRFLREAAMGRSLHHANIAGIIEIIEDEAQLALVMEYVEGRSLRHCLDEGLSLEQGRPMLVGIAKALCHAHEQGIIHRDLKPDNVLVEDTGRPRVVDWGLAKSTIDASGLTRTGVLVGTPEYMAPEQILGEDCGPATDLYALGIIAFELCAGTTPFSAPTVGETITGHLSGTLPNLLRLAPATPPAFAVLVKELLQKSPDERPATAAAVVTRLSERERASALTSCVSRVTTRPTQSRQTAGQRRRAPLLACVCAGLLLFGLLFVHYSGHEQGKRRGQHQGSPPATALYSWDEVDTLRAELLSSESAISTTDARLLGVTVLGSSRQATVSICRDLSPTAVGLWALATEATRRKNTTPRTNRLVARLISQAGAFCWTGPGKTLVANADTHRLCQALATLEPQNDWTRFFWAHLTMASYHPGLVDRELAGIMANSYAAAAEVHEVARIGQRLFAKGDTWSAATAAARFYFDALHAIGTAAAKEECLQALSTALARQAPAGEDCFAVYQIAVSLLLAKARDLGMADDTTYCHRLLPLFPQIRALMASGQERAVLQCYQAMCLKSTGAIDAAASVLDELEEKQFSPKERWRLYWARSSIAFARDNRDQAISWARQGLAHAFTEATRFYFSRRIKELPLRYLSIDPKVKPTGLGAAAHGQ